MLLADEVVNSDDMSFEVIGEGPVQVGPLVLWALADHLGSVRDLVDNSGVRREHKVYDSFGNVLEELDYGPNQNNTTPIPATDPNAVDTIFGYTGREWDDDVSLQYNRARWYDATTGRWLSQDPIGFAAGDANLYRYVGNDATNATDPSGLVGDWTPWGIYWWLKGPYRGGEPIADWVNNQVNLLDSMAGSDPLTLAAMVAAVNLSDDPDRHLLGKALIERAVKRRMEQGDDKIAAFFWVDRRVVEAGNQMTGSELNCGTEARIAIGYGSAQGPSVAMIVMGPAMIQQVLGARMLTQGEVQQIQAIADLYGVVIDIVGSRAENEGRNIHTDLPRGKDPKTSRSDIDFKFDATHPDADKIVEELRKVGGGVGSADKKYSTHTKPTCEPYIRFFPRKK